MPLINKSEADALIERMTGELKAENAQLRGVRKQLQANSKKLLEEVDLLKSELRLKKLELENAKESASKSRKNMDEQIDRLNEVLVSHQCAAKTATDAAEKNLAEERRRTTIAQSKVRQLEGTVKAADTNAGRHMNLTNEQKLRINGLHNTNREQTDHIEKLEAFIATMTNAAGGMAETLLSFARMEFRRKALDVKGGSDGKRCH